MLDFFCLIESGVWIAGITQSFNLSVLDNLSNNCKEKCFDNHNQNFLIQLKKLCEKNGALLIFDEVVSGFRFSLGGAQELIGVTPHLSAFGKAMANGFSVSALVGQEEFMKLAGIKHYEERVFLLSTTHGGETHSIAAAIACINEIKDKNIISHFWETGRLLMSGINKVSKETCNKLFLFMDSFLLKAKKKLSWEFMLNFFSI